jgi:hypothetical protein
MEREEVWWLYEVLKLHYHARPMHSLEHKITLFFAFNLNLDVSLAFSPTRALSQLIVTRIQDSYMYVHRIFCITRYIYLLLPLCLLLVGTSLHPPPPQ